jgi:hypothetical protein
MQHSFGLASRVFWADDAVCSSLTMPAFTVIFGQVVTAFDGSGTQEINAIALGFLYRSRHGCRQLPQNAMFMLAGARLKPGHGCVQLNLLTRFRSLHIQLQIFRPLYPLASFHGVI